MRRLLFPALLLLAACDAVPARPPGQYPIARAELVRRAPADSPAEADYRRYCLPCHGVEGHGNGGTTGADFTSATGPLTRPDDQLVVSVRDGKRGSIGTMPPHGRLLTEPQIRAVLAYIRQHYGAGIVPVAEAPDAGVDAAAPR